MSRIEAMVRMATFVDRVDTDTGSAVLVDTPSGHRVVRLSAIGAAVLDVLTESGGSAGLEAITAGLVRRFGAPVDSSASDVVRTVLDDLAAEHLIVAES